MRNRGPTVYYLAICLEILQNMNCATPQKLVDYPPLERESE
jgi:hypothetical protein